LPHTPHFGHTGFPHTHTHTCSLHTHTWVTHTFTGFTCSHTPLFPRTLYHTHTTPLPHTHTFPQVGCTHYFASTHLDLTPHTHGHFGFTGSLHTFTTHTHVLTFCLLHSSHGCLHSGYTVTRLFTTVGYICCSHTLHTISHISSFSHWLDLHSHFSSPSFTSHVLDFVGYTFVHSWVSHSHLILYLLPHTHIASVYTHTPHVHRFLPHTHTHSSTLTTHTSGLHTHTVTHTHVYSHTSLDPHTFLYIPLTFIYTLTADTRSRTHFLVSHGSCLSHTAFYTATHTSLCCLLPLSWLPPTPFCLPHTLQLLGLSPLPLRTPCPFAVGLYSRSLTLSSGWVAHDHRIPFTPSPRVTWLTPFHVGWVTHSRTLRFTHTRTRPHARFHTGSHTHLDIWLPHTHIHTSLVSFSLPSHISHATSHSSCSPPLSHISHTHSLHSHSSHFTHTNTSPPCTFLFHTHIFIWFIHTHIPFLCHHTPWICLPFVVAFHTSHSTLNIHFGLQFTHHTSRGLTFFHIYIWFLSFTHTFISHVHSTHSLPHTSFLTLVVHTFILPCTLPLFLLFGTSHHSSVSFYFHCLHISLHVTVDSPSSHTYPSFTTTVHRSFYTIHTHTHTLLPRSHTSHTQFALSHTHVITLCTHTHCRFGLVYTPSFCILFGFTFGSSTLHIAFAVHFTHTHVYTRCSSLRFHILHTCTHLSRFSTHTRHTHTGLPHILYTVHTHVYHSTLYLHLSHRYVTHGWVRLHFILDCCTHIFTHLDSFAV